MDEHGYFDLDDLVVGSSVDILEWVNANYVFANCITDRDASGFGTICGWISTTDGGRGFVLTPIPKP